ncbi:593_t:CDS:2 [Funneliformis mosseae]|uniref:593_t:CDS:1 n=1 Tax=Funneliformis mosseae TaxID=27381 RepID=A0A9N8VZ82_FUNMO|nr:593_t:CDS:2 [Funneliformis mosseae]
MPRKINSATPVRRSPRFKRIETQDEITETTSPASNTRPKRARNEEEHHTTEETKREDSEESNAYEIEASKDVIIIPEEIYISDDTASVDTIVDDDMSKWEVMKKSLFDIPKDPAPPYHTYVERLLIKRPWMKKEDIDYLQNLFTDPESLLAKKQLKNLFNFEVFMGFSIEQKGRLLNLLPNCDMVPISDNDGEPIDSPRIQLEHINAGLEPYEAGVSGKVSKLDPNKVCPRFDFWTSDSFKDSQRWFQKSIKLGYNTSLGISIQWNSLENFKAVIPKEWKCDEYERVWGIGLEEKMGEKQIAGDSAQMSLPEMAKSKVIRLNDLWKYKRQFKNVGVTVSMDLKVVGINQSNGHLDFMLTKDGEDKIIKDVYKPTRLENEVLDFDGRVAKSSRPNSNAFKNFRIIRSEDYTPSLFETRKEYWAKIQ